MVILIIVAAVIYIIAQTKYDTRIVRSWIKEYNLQKCLVVWYRLESEVLNDPDKINDTKSALIKGTFLEDVYRDCEKEDLIKDLKMDNQMRLMLWCKEKFKEYTPWELHEKYFFSFYTADGYINAMIKEANSRRPKRN